MKPSGSSSAAPQIGFAEPVDADDDYDVRPLVPETRDRCCGIAEPLCVPERQQMTLAVWHWSYPGLDGV